MVPDWPEVVKAWVGMKMMAGQVNKKTKNLNPALDTSR